MINKLKIALLLISCLAAACGTQLTDQSPNKGVSGQYEEFQYKQSEYKEPKPKKTKGCPKVPFSSKEGDLPLFLTNEHGADSRHAIWYIPEREGVGVPRFVRLADQYTDAITEQIAKEFYRLTQKKPYILVAELPRSQIDFNRPPDLSYESARMAACHQAFHREAQRLVSQINSKWGNGYLLDIHGQSKFPDRLVRGTRNGESVRKLIKQEGDIYAGKKGLFGLLDSKGYNIMPKHHGYEEFYIGGYMLKQYGSQRPSGIDAVQIEIGRHYRDTPTKQQKIATDIAQVLMRRMQNLGYLSR